jgi:hypothetical protein
MNISVCKDYTSAEVIESKIKSRGALRRFMRNEKYYDSNRIKILNIVTDI